MAGNSRSHGSVITWCLDALLWTFSTEMANFSTIVAPSATRHPREFWFWNLLGD